MLKEGKVLAACAIKTRTGTQVDTAWALLERFEQIKQEVACSIAQASAWEPEEPTHYPRNSLILKILLKIMIQFH